MEKKLLNLLTALCVFSLPFIFKGTKMRENLLILFSKGVLATLIMLMLLERKEWSIQFGLFQKFLRQILFMTYYFSQF